MAYLRCFNDPAIICDSTCFSISSFDESIPYVFDSMTSAQKVVPDSAAPAAAPASTLPVHTFPALPNSHSFSVLGNVSHFHDYIHVELPLAPADEGPVSPLPPPQPAPPAEKLRRSVNSAFINSFLKRPDKVVVARTLEWVSTDVFPDIKLPAAFLQVNVTSCEKLWDSKSSTLSDTPVAMTEADIRVWLNQIGNNLAATHNINTSGSTIVSADRAFDSRTATKGPAGGYMLRKPDISVIDRSLQHDSTKDERLCWRNIEAFIEVTASASVKDVLRQISQKAACMFDAQPQRQFACAIGIFGAPKSLQFIFAVVDRAGIIHTELKSIRSYSAIDFLRIIFAFCFASPETLGCDKSMEVNPNTGDVTHITVDGVEHNSITSTQRRFAVVKLLHSSPILYGRGTWVWIVRDENNSFYVLKDSWIQQVDVVSEIEFIKHIEKVLHEDPDGRFLKHAHSRYYIGQECVCSTDAIRGLLPKPPTRVQRRIVTGPIGDPITSFRSKHEFVSIMLDIVNCMSHVRLKLGLNNISWQSWSSSPKKEMLSMAIYLSTIS